MKKYRDLSIELMSLWKRKCEIIPIVVGCLGCVTHVLESNLKKLIVFDLCNVELLQRTALLGSSFAMIPLGFTYLVALYLRYFVPVLVTVISFIIDSCNMSMSDLPDMYAQSPRAAGPRAEGIHISQITSAHVTTIM